MESAHEPGEVAWVTEALNTEALNTEALNTGALS
jgi:hypothetical protein